MALDRYLRVRARHKFAHLDALWLGRRGALTIYGIRELLQRYGASAADARARAAHRRSGEISGILLLTVEAEHRTPEFDHTTSFTISGTPAAVDRVLLAVRAAYLAQTQPSLDE